ncbi:flagellar brake protein [Paenibacillus rigui]|uniref:PilZ domain-containing protein n=1 Tax=Paenibacillus rigui TaxID=554312 RepID=A0A229UW53_9BACL|nr:PilZ domain-containing protein [Paenibacillus rigui]OXM87654.1 PilZ domain-containing protein [Paenibacillus rigui]
MNWNQALALEMVAPRMSCSLIIVGETKEGTPFCYEDQFTLQKLDEEQMVASLEFHTMNPLEKLHHVCFIEFSFRERGILYYAFVDLLQLENKRNIIYLKLSAPQELSMFQNRRFQRLHLSSRTPLTCRIIGIRKSSTHQGIAFTGHIQDISAGGLSFITNTRIFYPLYLELSFVLPDHPHKFVVHGEIIRVAHFSSDSYRIAVEFRNMPESLTHQIDEYCSRSTV